VILARTVWSGLSLAVQVVVVLDEATPKLPLPQSKA
jgi:hypothetical protein